MIQYVDFEGYHAHYIKQNGELSLKKGNYLTCEQCTPPTKKQENKPKTIKRDFDPFTYLKGRNPNCPQCHGKGTYFYDEIHSTICNLCCPHDKGFWQLKVDYKDGKRLSDEEQFWGNRAGKYNCFIGCGFLKDELDKKDKLIKNY